MLSTSRVCAALAAGLFGLTAVVALAEGQAFTDPAKAGPDFAVQGEYNGSIKHDNNEIPIGVQVIAAPWREDLCLRVARALEAAGVVSAPVARL